VTYIYAALAALLLFVGGFAMHLWDNHRYDGLQGDYRAYKAQVATQIAAQTEEARKALQGQVDEAYRQAKENDLVLQDLHQKLAAADALRVHERARFDSLLQSASKAACRGGVPQAGGVPGTASSSPAPSLGDLGSTCEAIAHEDRDNADQLEALIRQIRGQL
jgi:hypothetical protein